MDYTWIKSIGVAKSVATAKLLDGKSSIQNEILNNVGVF